MTKTCPQCGCVLASSVRACNFCDSNFRAESSWYDDDEREIPAPKKVLIGSQQESCVSTKSVSDRKQDVAWRGELGQRVEEYRVRRGTSTPDAAQSRLPFGEPAEERRSVAVAEPSVAADDDFSFTIAIGRYSPPNDKRDGRMLIDVSVPPGSEPEEYSAEEGRSKHYGLYPVASLEDRRVAGAIDGACLLFAYGGFLALFSSLGGQFTLSKLTALVYVTTFAIVYLQYFALFTVFGGTTPGMMFRGLQVASFSGAPPSPRQLLLRSLGYVLSACACFTGFLWAWWDEDRLTWHDRISRTYLSSPATRSQMHAASAARGQ